MMYNARIIVTVNPANWEGDFRLWEAMATGALILVDPLLVPHYYPLIDQEHVVYFSNQNKSDLWGKLDYYRSHPAVARQIALNGYLHAMKYHRAVSMIDYVLRTAHEKKQLTRNNKGGLVGGAGSTREGAVGGKDSALGYRYTGQYLNRRAREQEASVKSRQFPGVYRGRDIDDMAAS